MRARKHVPTDMCAPTPLDLAAPLAYDAPVLTTSVTRFAWSSCVLIAACNAAVHTPPPAPALVATPPRPAEPPAAEPSPAEPPQPAAPAATLAAPSRPGPQPCAVAPAGMRCVVGGDLPDQPDVWVSTFYLDERTVTNAEYAACQTAGACSRRPAKQLVAAAPAALDWPRARQYCAWAGKRLPTAWERSLAAGAVPLAGPPEWTATAGKQPLGPARGGDPQGLCDGAYPCSGARVLLSSGTGDARLEPERSLRRAPAVRCAATRPQLTAWPPGQVADPPDRPAEPGPLSDELRRRLLALDHDPIEDKPICAEEVRATWGPALARGGRATTTCRDPFPYIKANEGRTHVWAPFVTNLGGAYLGVASDQNYSLIAAARSELAFVMDYDPRVVALHRRLRALILRSETPEAFIARFAPEALRESLAVLESVYADAPDLPAIKAGFRATREDLQAYYRTQQDAPPRGQPADFGWLQPEHYAYIRSLYLQDRIIPIKGDLMGTRSITAIAAAIRAAGVPLRVVYLSNAPTAWGGQITPGYRNNLLALPLDDRSVVLQTTNSGGFRQMGYWHYNIHAGPHLQQLLRRPGYDTVFKTLGERIPTPDGDVTITALPGAAAP